LTVPISSALIPGDVQVFLREAERRIERFRSEGTVPGFVPSDFVRAYQALQVLAGGTLTTGKLLCEWGSGFGAVTCLAAVLGFEACGIEIEAVLVRQARQLAVDFDIRAEFIRGSFIPAGCKVGLDAGICLSWLTIQGPELPEILVGPEDFDVIYAYPWPGEEKVILDLFESRARNGAILVTYHGDGPLRLRRQTARRGRRASRR
jgi:hypothetical protein